MRKRVVRRGLRSLVERLRVHRRTLGRAEGFFDARGEDVMSTVGTSFCAREIDAVTGGGTGALDLEVFLVRDARNLHDPNAIVVQARDGRRLAYLDQATAATYAPAFDHLAADALVGAVASRARRAGTTGRSPFATTVRSGGASRAGGARRCARIAGMSFDLELRDACAEAWEAQLTHPFVVGIGDGSLPRERFQHYVAQDYVFLIDYGRLLALVPPAPPISRRCAGSPSSPRRSSSPRWICTARSLMPGASTSPPLRPRVPLPRRAPTSTRCCAPPPSATSPSSSPRCCRACGRTPRSARSSPLPVRAAPPIRALRRVGRHLRRSGVHRPRRLVPRLAASRRARRRAACHPRPHARGVRDGRRPRGRVLGEQLGAGAAARVEPEAAARARFRLLSPETCSLVGNLARALGG